ncbi:MAG TPA: cytochrome P460 family protein [Pyrinomonadaceae bacterium]|jgi:hypothetical protein
MTAAVKVSLVLFVLGLLVTIAVSSSKPANSEVRVRNDEFAPNKVIAGYKDWTLVNREPHRVSSQLSFQCAPPSARQLSMEKQNPHLNRSVLVYVNDIGKAAMLEQKVPMFPEGSVIVKEKWAISFRSDATSPELLTVMRKRDDGYDPDKGNWEYMVFDGTGQTLQADGKLENCQGCHMQHRATDYVTRVYLPVSVSEKLR